VLLRRGFADRPRRQFRLLRCKKLLPAIIPAGTIAALPLLKTAGHSGCCDAKSPASGIT
jgi:hypothetical protein